MAKFTPSVIIGNHLLHGQVVYWTAEAAWSDDFADALHFEAEVPANAQLSQAASQPGIAVGVEFAPVVDGQFKSRRDRIRQNGPSAQALKSIPNRRAA